MGKIKGFDLPNIPYDGDIVINDFIPSDLYPMSDNNNSFNFDENQDKSLSSFLKEWNKLFVGSLINNDEIDNFFVIRMKTISETFYYVNTQYIDYLITEKIDKAHIFKTIEYINLILSKPFFIESIEKENGNIYPPNILSLVGKIYGENDNEIVNLSVLKINHNYQIIETIIQKDIELKVIKPIGIKYIYD